MVEDSILQRLRAAHLRPTIPRIAILQAVEASGLQAVSAEGVFQRTMARGTQMGLGTVYRVLQQFEERGLLLREWSISRKTLYRLRPVDTQEQALYLVCRCSGRRIRVIDAVLYERLQAAAQNLGLSLAGRQVLIEVDGVSAEEPEALAAGPAGSGSRSKALYSGELTPEPA